MAKADPETLQDLISAVQAFLQRVQDQVQTMFDPIIGRTDDMSRLTEDLEKNIADLMTQPGVEELEGENRIPGHTEELTVAHLH
uniref:Heat shock factor-binding protein 1 n=1 Tax=Catagonus wagneri TaxID=51154 RepID=A0A8C3YR39_9CETA